MSICTRLSLASIGVMLFVLSATAQATLVTDIHDPAPDLYLAAPGGYSYTHNIIDDGFDTALDSIGTIQLEIDVYDDYDADYNRYGYVSGYCHGWGWRYHCHRGYSYLISAAQYENLNVTVDSTNLGTYEIDYDPLGFSTVDFGSLLADGILDVALSVTSGDLYFAKSTLTVEFERFVTDVPEPSALALIALGLMGVGAARKKHKPTV